MEQDPFLQTEMMLAGMAPGITQAPTPPDEKDPQKVKAFISWWEDRIRSAISFHEPAFKKMRKGMKFVRGYQWSDNDNDDRYTVNLAQSEVAASVATLYAKNPTFVVKRKPRMDFAIWDENPQMLQQLEQMNQQSMQGMPMDPAVQAMIMDIAQGMERRRVVEGVARTLEIVLRHQISQVQPNFKRQMKQLVRRVETTGVGYVKLGYRRMQDTLPEASTKLADINSRMTHAELLDKKLMAEENNTDREQEEARIASQSLQQQRGMVVKEGLDLFFPKSTAIIIDPNCYELKGFMGARWLCEEYQLTADAIFSTYKKDVSATSPYCRSTNKDGWTSMRRSKDDRRRDYDDFYRVWEIYHPATGSVFTICEGFDDYLREPTPPVVLLEQFFPYYPLSFNDVENEDSIFPPSTVELIMHPQKEVNRTKEALRQHKIASKPHYASMKGAFDEADKVNMMSAEAHAVIELNALQPGMSTDQLFQQIKKHAIDPNLYETNGSIDDIRRITRRPDARLGGASSSTATADSLAEESRQVEDRSKSDDIDDLLTDLARDAGTTLIMNMDAETVKKIAGPGAVWPTVAPEEVLQDIDMEIVAGSSGRPNRALEASTFQRLFPILVQTPGILPSFLARKAVELTDSNIDLSEAYLEGAPSIMSINKMAQTATGNPATDPSLQGPQGSQNAAPLPPGQDQSFSVNSPMLEVPETATENSILQ